MKIYFSIVLSYIGTDGLRGIYGEGFFTEKFLEALAYGFVDFFFPEKPGFLLAYDTRHNGFYITEKIKDLLISKGFSVKILGLCSSPEMSFYSQKERKIGLMISASHNPWPYNGIKFFTTQGKKWCFSSLQLLESFINCHLEKNQNTLQGLAFKKDLSTMPHKNNNESNMHFTPYETYEDFLLHHGGDLSGLSLVIDGANGAYYKKAIELFQQAGAHVLHVIGNSPDGYNINDKVGSLYPQKLQDSVIKYNAHIGFAFDGDGDRVVAVDHKGQCYDGSHLIALLSFLFPQGGIVGTPMTNGAFKDFCVQWHRPFLCVDVGDHHIAKALENHQWILGAEPSGHLLLGHLAPTCDGLLSAFCIAYFIKNYDISFLLENKPENSRDIPFLVEKAKYAKDSLGEQKFYSLHKPFHHFPSLTHNYTITPEERKILCSYLPKITEEAQNILGASYRIFLRFSGTEPVLRLFLEGPSEDILKTYGNNIIQSIKKILNH